MKIMMATVVAGMASGAWAEDVRLDEAAISAVLTGQTLTYDDGSAQEFRAGGKTIYGAGSASEGGWRVSGGQYCSVWPPSDRWACYDVLQSADGQTVTFVAADGSLSVGHLAE